MRGSAIGSLPGWPLVPGRAGVPPLRRLLERAAAAGYARTYDAIVRPFVPYQTLLRDIVGLIDRSEPDRLRNGVTVLDVACGTGTVALRLAREGFRVVGVDMVAPLVEVASLRAGSAVGPVPRFEHRDLVRDALPGAGSFDVVVSMHTLSWHPDPEGLLAAALRALKPGGHAIFLTYTRPARVIATFREVRRREGLGAAVHALRWLVPTAAFEMLRHYTPHYASQDAFHGSLTTAGFEVLDARRTFIADLSLMAWIRKPSTDTGEIT